MKYRWSGHANTHFSAFYSTAEGKELSPGRALTNQRIIQLSHSLNPKPYNILGLYRGFRGIMEKKMETTISGFGFRGYG